jgi:hypothetical protein
MDRSKFGRCVFLGSAAFLGGGWWRAIATIAAAWFLYKVTLYYQLRKTGELPEGHP